MQGGGDAVSQGGEQRGGGGQQSGVRQSSGPLPRSSPLGLCCVSPVSLLSGSSSPASEDPTGATHRALAPSLGHRLRCPPSPQRCSPSRRTPRTSAVKEQSVALRAGGGRAGAEPSGLAPPGKGGAEIRRLSCRPSAAPPLPSTTTVLISHSRWELHCSGASEVDRESARRLVSRECCAPLAIVASLLSIGSFSASSSA